MSYTPMGTPEPMPDLIMARASRDEPKIVWILILLPILQLVQFPFGSLTLVPTLVTSLLIAAAAVPSAMADQRTLFANGHVRRTPTALAIVPIVYLAVRGSRRFEETGHGMKPFWIALVIVIIVITLLIWGPEGMLALLI